VRALGALVTGAVLLSACTGGDDPDPTSATDTGFGGDEVIREFAAAWPEPTAANLRGLVDEPAVAARDISAHVAELGITDTDVDLAGDLDCGDDSCREHAQVTHQLAGFGEWSYGTLIKASRNQSQWLVEWSPGTFHPDLTEVTTLALERQLPVRAPILDRNGVALTPEQEIVRVGVVPSEVRPITYERLAAILEIDTAALRDRVAGAQPDWFVSVIDLRRDDYEPLRAQLLEVPGISVDTARRALAPTAEWGRAILGTVGPATEETLENAGPYALPTDDVGTTGLQYAFQERLAGTPGVRIALIEKSTGDELNQVLSERPQPGQPLETTLDLGAQNAAENAIAGVEDTTAVLVVKASTGEVLAAANGPGPTTFNTAFIGEYAPGSTFKAVSAAALLLRDVVRPSSSVSCPDTTVVGGKQFKNYDTGITGPDPTFADAFAASCNTTFVNMADEITGQTLAKTGRLFGFGADWEVGLPAYSGSVPADTDLVTRAADMIGQGKVLASPLMMAMVAAGVDSGVSRTPTLLPGLAPGSRLSAIDPDVVADLQSMMRLVVTEGTASGLVVTPGPPLHAKTGTAEVQEGKRTTTNAWMIGYRGDVAFAVLVENGDSGSQDAGPIVQALINGLPRSLYE
jgi:cell division protein FtsI/penicillin-binding protein 2